MTQDFLASFNVSGGVAFSAGIGVASIAIIVMGEIIPKNIAQAHGSHLFRYTLPLTNIIFYCMYPLVNILSKLSSLVINVIRSRASDTPASIASEKEIQFLIDYINKQGIIDSDKTQMLNSIFDLGNTTVEQIMVAEADIISINVETSLRTALDAFSNYHFSRLPVYEHNTDNIIGMVHQKDVFIMLSKYEEKPLKELVRPILFVPESLRVNQLLRQLKQQRHHIAMVLNEFGSIVGLVTLEDAIEEIIGDISDEHQSLPHHIIPVAREGWLVYAGTPLHDLEKILKIRFERKDAVSLAGFLTERMQHLPIQGELLQYAGYVFKIHKTTEKRIIQVLIFKNEIPESFVLQ